MGLKAIHPQPIRMTPRINDQVMIDTFCPDCTDEPNYCFKTGAYDQLFLQMENIPSPTTIDCESLIEPIYVTQMANSADWNFTDGWTYDGTNEYFHGVFDGGGANTIELELSAFTPVTGTFYTFSPTFVGITGGSVEIYWGSTLIDTVSTDGTYTYFVTAVNGTDTFNMLMLTPFDGLFTGFSISAFAPGWTVDNGWIPDANGGCGWCVEDGNVNPISIVVDYLLAAAVGSWFKISFEIRNRTRGGIYVEGQSATLNFDIGSDNFFNTNGVHSTYVLPDANTKVRFASSPEFDGCIYNIKIETQCRAHRAFLFDGTTDMMVDEVTDLLVFEGDYMTMTGFFLGLYNNPVDDIGKCYYICISECGGVVSDDVLNTDPEFDDDGAWYGSGAIGISGSAAIFGIGESVIGQTVPGLDQSRCFSVSFTISEIGGDSQLAISLYGTQIFSGTITSTGTYTISNITLPVLPTEELVITGLTGYGFEMDSIYITYDPSCGTEFDWCSNCMQYIGNPFDEIIGCTARVVASMDEKQVAFGFLFANYFAIAFRERFVFSNPKTDGTEEKYKYNNGNNSRTSAQIEETYDVSIGFVDKNIHSTIGMMLKLDYMEFKYKTNDGNQTLYTGNEKDYAGNWPKVEKVNTTTGKFEVVKKLKSAGFMNNAI